MKDKLLFILLIILAVVVLNFLLQYLIRKEAEEIENQEKEGFLLYTN